MSRLVPSMGRSVLTFRQLGFDSRGARQFPHPQKRLSPVPRTGRILIASRLVTKGAFMRRHLRGDGMRRLPVRFAAVPSGRPGKGPQGTTTRPSMKDYRLRPSRAEIPAKAGTQTWRPKPKMTFRVRL